VNPAPSSYSKYSDVFKMYRDCLLKVQSQLKLESRKSLNRWRVLNKKEGAV